MFGANLPGGHGYLALSLSLSLSFFSSVFFFSPVRVSVRLRAVEWEASTVCMAGCGFKVGGQVCIDSLAVGGNSCRGGHVM
jgi:hypothetical protein